MVALWAALTRFALVTQLAVAMVSRSFGLCFGSLQPAREVVGLWLYRPLLRKLWRDR